MIGQQRTISGSDLEHLLSEAADHSMAATTSWCSFQPRGVSPKENETIELEEALAYIAARATEKGWNLLPPTALDARAPIVWAVHEIMEWAEHLVRYECQGDQAPRVPITWLPTGSHPLGTRHRAAAVKERVDLLRQELAECGVIVRLTKAAELAA